LVTKAAALADRQFSRLGDRLFDAVVNWALKHRRKENGRRPHRSDPLRPDGKALRRVLVPQGRGDAPPEDRTPERE